MIKKLECCLYCGEKMDSKTAKKKFCSTMHRVYWNRENKKPLTTIKVIKEVVKRMNKEAVSVNSKKEMPAGLGRIEQMRWIRENS